MNAVIGFISLMLVALAALLWAAGVIPSTVAARITVAAFSIYLVNAVVQAVVVELRRRRRERDAAAAIAKLREATVASLIRNDYVLGIAEGEIKAGDLVRLENGKVKTVTRLADTPEGKIQ